ncbi:hypothetical protein LEP1GSC124_4712 [Leptospira interrogans serovar Pyrogenes str. 200701872]|uniref:Uncharacterized protein n=1 Tax=Leptospira interrogans serovar Pyrogenes str. 200701872 TaxID=1193029 RepID=M6ZE79_LEPIR|nr:hypothetical protein LEP1GSC124_4712 [Leptospira interrogans serovar Pyrogenes str. 200701872]
MIFFFFRNPAHFHFRKKTDSMQVKIRVLRSNLKCFKF